MSESLSAHPGSSKDPVRNWAFEVLDIAVDRVRASGGPLVPFLFVQGEGGERQSMHAAANTPEQSVTRAFGLLATLDYWVGAVAYDGDLQHDGGLRDAVVVEARGTGERVVRLAQRYETRGRLWKKVHLVGDPIVVSERG